MSLKWRLISGRRHRSQEVYDIYPVAGAGTRRAGFLLSESVSGARLERKSTGKEEIRQRGFERDIPAGFLTYPASQAADITAFKASLVPVGEDQIPMIEQSN